MVIFMNLQFSNVVLTRSFLLSKASIQLIYVFAKPLDGINLIKTNLEFIEYKKEIQPQPSPLTMMSVSKKLQKMFRYLQATRRTFLSFIFTLHKTQTHKKNIQTQHSARFTLLLLVTRILVSYNSGTSQALRLVLSQMRRRR